MMLGYASGTELAFIAYLFIITVVVLAVTDHRRRR